MQKSEIFKVFISAGATSLNWFELTENIGKLSE